MKKILGLLLLTIILSGCNHIEIQSLWKDFEIEIDGKDSDWDDAKIYIKDKNMVVAVANDNDYLYLCFYPTTNESVRQVLKQGISLWFNADGKKDRDNGISYPLPMSARNKLDKNSKNQHMNRDNSGNPSSTSEVEKMVHNIKLRNGEVKISTDSGVSELPIPGLIGMEICMDAENGVFAYEAKIPLNDPTASYSLGIEPGAEMMIGLRSEALESNEPDESLDPDMNADIESGNSSGSGRGSQGGARGKSGSRSGGMEANTEMRLWANIKLAVNPN